MAEEPIRVVATGVDSLYLACRSGLLGCTEPEERPLREAAPVRAFAREYQARTVAEADAASLVGVVERGAGGLPGGHVLPRRAGWRRARAARRCWRRGSW